ncbi:MAG TPA: hypothetical protein VNJ07_13295 [Chitinophagales bacterium]|nr:hypothetical protein [Chitinophagales bacterium]
MKRKTAQNFILTLNEFEYAPFLYFLSLSALPAEVDDKWQAGNETIRLSLCMPLDFDPSILTEMWYNWKEEALDIDYAPLN